MFDFNKMPYIYWTDIEKISFLQRYILIHSILYYEMNESVITDKEYDSVAKQLYKAMQNIDVVDITKTQYYYVFENFIPDTGFDLYDKLDKWDKKFLKHIAFIVLKQYKKENKK